jgi:hypothetical protein
MFKAVADAWTAREPSLDDCSGLIAAIGPSFESRELVVSTIHALGIAAAARNQQSEVVHRMEAFLQGRDGYAAVPPCLARFGLRSAVRRDEAVEFLEWIRSVDKRIFEEQVRSMFGPDAVAVYSAVARSLDGIFESVTIHDADLGWIDPRT